MKYEEIMACIQDINGPWSNAACLGYCRMAMQNAGVDECTQRKVLRELEACFDQVSVEEASANLAELLNAGLGGSDND